MSVLLDLREGSKLHVPMELFQVDPDAIDNNNQVYD
jgi:hypothetical protein